MKKLFVVFLLTSIAVGILYWSGTDWWAYVGDKPKFEMPLWWQVGESSVVGCVAGVFITTVTFLVWTFITFVIKIASRGHGTP